MPGDQRRGTRRRGLHDGPGRRPVQLNMTGLTMSCLGVDGLGVGRLSVGRLGVDGGCHRGWAWRRDNVLGERNGAGVCAVQLAFWQASRPACLAGEGRGSSRPGAPGRGGRPGRGRYSCLCAGRHPRLRHRSAHPAGRRSTNRCRLHFPGRGESGGRHLRGLLRPAPDPGVDDNLILLGQRGQPAPCLGLADVPHLRDDQLRQALALQHRPGGQPGQQTWWQDIQPEVRVTKGEPENRQNDDIR
jgi:hypothetical protein